MKRNRILGAFVAMFAVALAASAFALNVNQNNDLPARLLGTQQVSYYRVTVNFNDPNISTAQKFGTLPQLSFIDDVKCEVTTAFNAGTTNVFTLGTTTTATEIVNAGDMSEASTGVTQVTRGWGRGLTASGDTTLYAKYTQTGTAATAGAVTCVIKFIPNNDL